LLKFIFQKNSSLLHQRQLDKCCNRIDTSRIKNGISIAIGQGYSSPRVNRYKEQVDPQWITSGKTASFKTDAKRE